MKRVSAMAVAVLALASAMFAQGTDEPKVAKPQSTQVCTLKVSGMTCAGCEAAVRMAARTIEGVKDVKASYDKGNAEVTYDPSKTNPDAIAKVISEKSGFKAEAVPHRAQK